MARHTPMLPPPPQPPSPRLRGANASRSTLSLHPNAAAVLLLWGWKSAGAGALRPSPLSTTRRGQGASHPPGLQAAAVGAYTRRWAALLSCTAQRAFSASLLELPLGATDHTDGDPPPFFDLLAKREETNPPTPSRLPLRQGIWPCDQWRWKRCRRKKKFYGYLRNHSQSFPIIPNQYGKMWEVTWNPICIINLWKRGEDAGGLPFPLDQWTVGLRGGYIVIIIGISCYLCLGLLTQTQTHIDPHFPANVPYNAAETCLD